MIAESFIKLIVVFSSERLGRGWSLVTYRIISACLVKLPKRWEEKTIVLLPLRRRKRSNKSELCDEQEECHYWELLTMFRSGIEAC